VKAIVVGASSGIGAALARVLARNGYAVGLMARRLDLLLQLQQELGTAVSVKQCDVTHTTEAMKQLSSLIDEMRGVNLVVISAGTGFLNPSLEWSLEKETIAVNVDGFTAMVNIAMRHFLQAGKGHLVGISSIAALRGNREAPAYNASKAYMSNYLEGLRMKAAKLRLPIFVTDVQPGFVNTAMAKGDHLFWVASPEKAAAQIFRAIRRKRRRVYVTRRWRLIAWFLKWVPDFLLDRL
jgi:short-subunit dehydrogenase